ncbi:MAG: hypothetical protein JHD15_21710 [Phenylobacterium sp.]|uniref:hypothetical protein n=1 Tax=Phenylobacterium sp. TaxID=1871053 RepID=UPI001A29AABC|nr:hypothetical protein [Phenylobacterium sp.]MBJ7412953.1 hypothetical protein [Phenylobacterium sp.]
MDLKPGSRWKSAVCDAELVVVRPPKSPVSLECGGHPVIPHADTRTGDLALSDAHAAGAAAGKRYSDAESGLEVLCSKAGRGSLSVDGRAIGAQEAKKLPSSD